MNYDRDAQFNLPPTFEGRLELMNTDGLAKVVNHETEDPFGRGLSRHWEVDRKTWSQLNGQVWWRPEVKAGPGVDTPSVVRMFTRNATSIVHLL